MNDIETFEAFLIINPKYYKISVHNSSDSKIIYEQKKIINNDLSDINFSKLKDFLEENIFKIEKVLGNFIKDIILIIDFDIFFKVQISVKKNNTTNKANSNDLNYLLNETKDLCKETMNGKKIVHMLIDNYQIDNKNYSNLPKDIKYNYLSLDVSFICLSNDVAKSLEKTLKNFQVSIAQMISANYIKNFFSKESHDYVVLTKKLLEGCNQNEVVLVKKTQKIQGFFEKFFHLYS
ncbi:hypothetical protein IDH32_06310 [Pelagibacterales bacterium SAG-MED01]|nr:hypothetical protein [Pelagibacterales bacterium SAG-MED01]